VGKERKLVSALSESLPVYSVNEFDFKHIKVIPFLPCSDGFVEPLRKRDAFQMLFDCPRIGVK
jgi:hypothetical protein